MRSPGNEDGPGSAVDKDGCGGSCEIQRIFCSDACVDSGSNAASPGRPE
jgi:hypothetical protein